MPSASAVRVRGDQVTPSALLSAITRPAQVPARWSTTAPYPRHVTGALTPGASMAGSARSKGLGRGPLYSPGRVAQRPSFTVGLVSRGSARCGTTARAVDGKRTNRPMAFARRGSVVIVTTSLLLLRTRTDVRMYGHDDSTPVLLCQEVLAQVFGESYPSLPREHPLHSEGRGVFASSAVAFRRLPCPI